MLGRKARDEEEEILACHILLEVVSHFRRERWRAPHGRGGGKGAVGRRKLRTLGVVSGTSGVNMAEVGDGARNGANNPMRN